MTPRLLFHSASRRGLGHVMRAANLARAVQARDPRAEVLVHLTNPAAGPACGEVPWQCGDPDEPGVWADLLAGFRPTLTVFDTMLPGPWAIDAPGVRQAFVWRASVDVRQQATANDARLQRMAAIVVPHTPAEFGTTLPPALEARTVFTGPIVRASDTAGQARVRARYGLTPDDVIVTSTAGGGGFDGSAAWLHEVVTAAHRAWLPRVPRLRHLLIRGPLAPPLAPAAVAGLPGLTVIDADLDLVHLLAISTLVVAEAGYNTIHELRQVGTPAVLVPGPRTYDDQGARAEAMAALGVARVVDRRDPEAAVTVLVEALTPPALAEMRAAAARTPFTAGNARAADALLAVAS